MRSNQSKRSSSTTTSGPFWSVLSRVSAWTVGDLGQTGWLYAFLRRRRGQTHARTGISNPAPSSGESANFRSLSRWRASNAPAPRLCAGVKIIAFHRRDASDVQRAIDHRSSRTPVQLVASLFAAIYPLGREITRGDQ